MLCVVTFLQRHRLCYCVYLAKFHLTNSAWKWNESLKQSKWGLCGQAALFYSVFLHQTPRLKPKWRREGKQRETFELFTGGNVTEKLSNFVIGHFNRDVVLKHSNICQAYTRTVKVYKFYADYFMTSSCVWGGRWIAVITLSYFEWVYTTHLWKSDSKTCFISLSEHRWLSVNVKSKSSVWNVRIERNVIWRCSIINVPCIRFLCVLKVKTWWQSIILRLCLTVFRRKKCILIDIRHENRSLGCIALHL